MEPSPLWVVWWFSASAWWWHVELTPGWASIWVVDDEAACIEVLNEKFKPLLKQGDMALCQSAFSVPPIPVAEPVR